MIQCSISLIYFLRALDDSLREFLVNLDFYALKVEARGIIELGDY